MTKVIDVSEAERRRDKRHNSFVPARLNGEPVTLLDVSLGGFGGTIELRADSAAFPEVGEPATLEIDPDSASGGVTVMVEMRRCDRDLLLFGAQLVEISDDQFRALERLSMGRRL